MEAPSPAPIPFSDQDDLEGVIVKAEQIHKEHYYKVRLREGICKLKITNEEGNIYYIEITPKHLFWLENKKYFQEDFEKFSQIMNETLILEKGGIKHKILKEDFDEILLQLIHNGIFGFQITISIPRKKDRIDLVDNEVQDIIKHNEENDIKIKDFEKRIDYLERIIKMNIELREFHDGPFVDFPRKESSLNWINCKHSEHNGHGTQEKIIGDCKRIPIDWIKTNKHLDYYKDRYGVDLQQNRCIAQKGSGIYAPDTGDINEGIKICNIKVDPRTINGVNDLKVKKWVNLVTKWLVPE